MHEQALPRPPRVAGVEEHHEIALIGWRARYGLKKADPQSS
jgi:hypothetical protein